MTAFADSSPAVRFLTAAAWAFAGIANPGNVALAGSIVWGAPQSITGDSNVITAGTLVYAYNFGPTSVTSATVNGVTFQAFGIPGGGASVSQDAVTIQEFPGSLFWGNQSSASNPFAGLGSGYQNLLSSNVTASSPDTITLTLGGLSAGAVYDFQWWSNRPTTPVYSTTALAGNSVMLSSNTYAGSEEGGLGQYAIGRFTASGTSQSIDFSGSYFFGSSNMPSINGFQVRLVPEPSTWVMGAVGLACAGWTVSRRRRR